MKGGLTHKNLFDFDFIYFSGGGEYKKMVVVRYENGQQGRERPIVQVKDRVRVC
jgi:hypothetical protein